MKIKSPLTVASSMMTTAACLLMIFNPMSTSNAQDPYGRVVQEQPSGPKKYELIIRNRANDGSSIVSVTAKSVKMTNFSVNLLPFPIRDGRQGLVNLYDGNGNCEWRIRAEFDDRGNAEEILNVCSTSYWNINPHRYR